jgi:hypothetical protein
LGLVIVGLSTVLGLVITGAMVGLAKGDFAGPAIDGLVIVGLDNAGATTGFSNVGFCGVVVDSVGTRDGAIESSKHVSSRAGFDPSDFNDEQGNGS